MAGVQYIPRIADARLDEALSSSGGVAIQGVKGCGKAETALQKARSILRADVDPNVGPALGVAPVSLLQGETPRLIDEWQEAPVLWDLARHEIDDRKLPGQFIFTGSTHASEKATKHSGAGRFVRLKMSTMSLYESGESDGAVSLRSVAQRTDIDYLPGEMALEALAERMCRGGWPGSLGKSLKHAMMGHRGYIDSIAHVDISDPDGSRRDPERVRAVLRSLARNVATECDVSTIAADTSMSRPTTLEYLDSLARIFVSEDQPAWSSKLRSRTPLRKAPKRHLVDPALAMAALERGPEDLLGDLEYMGQLFESQVVHDLRVYSDNVVAHARLKTGAEVDAVVNVEGSTMLVEVKLGYYPEVVEQAAASLEAFATHLDTKPVMLIATGGGAAYRRPDGIYVVPLNRLGP